MFIKQIVCCISRKYCQAMSTLWRIDPQFFYTPDRILLFVDFSRIVFYNNSRKKKEGHGLKIGRNDPCPCGSGKKYKKCCLRKNQFDDQTQNTVIPAELTSNFEHIKATSKKINHLLQIYKFEDVVKAVFCLNLWRKNRSAIQQCLTLNLALDIGGNFGQTPIQSYIFSCFDALRTNILAFWYY